MRCLTGIAVVTAMCLGISGSAFAADKSVAPKKKAVEPSQPVLSNAQRAAIAEQATQSLNAKAWTIYIFPQGNAAGSVATDTLTFAGGSVGVESFKAKGFNPSNYSLTVQDDGAAIWETVQRNAENELALWRGEFRGDGINGVLSIKTAKGYATYAFSTLMPKQTRAAVPAAVSARAEAVSQQAK